MPRSISACSRTEIGLTSMPSEAADAWMMAHCPIPAGLVESRTTATRLTRGAISLTSSDRNRDRAHLHAERGSRRLDDGPLPDPGGIGRIAHYRHALDARRDLLDEFRSEPRSGSPPCRARQPTPG